MFARLYSRLAATLFVPTVFGSPPLVFGYEVEGSTALLGPGSSSTRGIGIRLASAKYPPFYNSSLNY